MTLKVILPNPHPGQRKVLKEAKRFNHLCAGRRWRKTTLCMSIAVEAAIKNRETIIWGAPTYQQSRVGFEETKRAANQVASFNEARMTVIFITGGQIIYRSLDKPDNVRGLSADGVVIDEIQSIKPEAYFEVLRPMLIDTLGWGWFIGTSDGHGWWYDERQKANHREDTITWNAPTLGVRLDKDDKDNPILIRDPHHLENPHIPLEEINNLFQTMPIHSFKREILSDDNALPEGMVYYNFDPQRHIIPYEEIPPLDQFIGFYTAHDFGSVNKVWLLIGQHRDGPYFVLLEEPLPRLTTKDRTHHILSKIEGLKLINSWGGSPGEDQFRWDMTSEGLTVNRPKIADVETQIDATNELFKDGDLLISSDCLGLRSNLEACARNIKGGIIDKSLYHYSDGLRYFAINVRKPKKSTIQYGFIGAKHAIVSIKDTSGLKIKDEEKVLAGFN